MEQEQSEIDRAFHEIVANTAWEVQSSHRVIAPTAPLRAPEHRTGMPHRIRLLLAVAFFAAASLGVAAGMFLFQLARTIHF